MSANVDCIGSQAPLPALPLTHDVIKGKSFHHSKQFCSLSTVPSNYIFFGSLNNNICVSSYICIYVCLCLHAYINDMAQEGYKKNNNHNMF